MGRLSGFQSGESSGIRLIFHLLGHRLGHGTALFSPSSYASLRIKCSYLLNQAKGCKLVHAGACGTTLLVQLVCSCYRTASDLA